MALKLNPITGKFDWTVSTPVTVDHGGTGTSTVFTQGSVVFAGASGVYSQDNANFFYDDTNNRLGIGTQVTTGGKVTIDASPGSPSLVALKIIQSTGASYGLELTSTGYAGIKFNAGTGYDPFFHFCVNGAQMGDFFYSGSTSTLWFNNNVNGPISFGTNGFNNARLTILGGGNVGIGNTAPSGTLHVYNSTPTTGTTKLIVQAGAADATGDFIFEVRNNAGTTLVSARRDGLFGATILSTQDILTAALSNSAAYIKGLNLAYQAMIGWSASTQWFDAKDTGLSRGAAGKVYVGNGTTGDYTGTLIATKLGAGVIAPTAWLHLAAGTATANTAPLKFTTGTNLTTPEVGTMEYNNRFSLTNSSGSRRGIVVSNALVMSTTTVTNTVTETEIYTHTFAANELAAYDNITFRLIGLVTNASAADDFTIRFKLGGVTIHTASRVGGNVTDAGWITEHILTVRTAGATGTIFDTSEYMEDGGLNYISADAAGHTVDTTAASTFSITVQWAAAKAGNIFSVLQGHTTFRH